MKTLTVRIFFLFFFAFFAGNVSAQVDTAKAAVLRKQLLDTLCSCVSKVDTSKIKTMDDVQSAVVQCFASDGMMLMIDYANASGADMTDVDKMQEFGKSIGMELTFKCPAFMKVISKLAQDPDQLKKMMEQNKKSSSGTGSD